jgi:polycomb group RING finger protein 4
LSITITNEQEEASANMKRNNSSAAVNNYIEILKLPEISITETEKKSPGAADKIKKEPISPKSDLKKSPSSDKKAQLDKRETFQEQFLQSILEKEKYKDKKPLTSTKTKDAVNGKSVANDSSINKSIESVKSNPELDLIKKVTPNKASATPPATKNLPILPKPPTGMTNGVRKSLSPPSILPKPSSSMMPKSKTPPVPPSPFLTTSFLNTMAKKPVDAKKGSNTTSKPSKSSKGPAQNQGPHDLMGAPNSPYTEQAALAMALKNGFENNPMAYFNEIARLSRQPVPQMVQPNFNAFNANQMMQAFFIQQQLNRMQKAGSDALENYVQSLQNNNQTSPKST